MPYNIEFKAILRNPSAAHATAKRLSAASPQILHQTDVFFSCNDGRLKLRLLGDGMGELIHYQRADRAEARRSDYRIATTPNAHVLLEILRCSLTETGTVKKIRALYLVGQTRVHIDQVEGLGDFLEIEVVMKPGQSDAAAQHIAHDLMNEFGITQNELLSSAYIDLRGAAL